MSGEVVTGSPGARGYGERVNCRNRGSVERGLSESRFWGNTDLFEGVAQLPRGSTWSLGCQHMNLAVIINEMLQWLSQGVG